MSAVWGVGTSRFAKQPDQPAEALVAQALREAFQDADLTPDRVETVYVGSVYGDVGVAQRALFPLGITDVPIITIENACASGTTAFHEACASVDLGRAQVALALGVECLTARFGGAIHPSPSDSEGATGLALPALYALAAARYLHEGWVTVEQLALVSVKNHRHALGNPRAQYAAELTVEQVLASRLIADPLTLLQCSPLSDAAAAAVIGPSVRGSRDRAVRSSVLRSGARWGHDSPHVWGYDLVATTAQQAYADAGVGPEDVGVFEVHDAFTIGEIVTTEALGLCELGGGGELVERRHTTLGGPQPVNPSGGLLSRGHPLGATGVAQIAEVVTQLRGEAHGRQAGEPRLGLVETMGGGVSGLDGNACVVAILE